MTSAMRYPPQPSSPSRHTPISPHTVRSVPGAGPLDNHHLVRTQQIDRSGMVDARRTSPPCASVIGQHNARGIPRSIQAHQARSSASSPRSSTSLSHPTQNQGYSIRSRPRTLGRSIPGVSSPLATAACLLGFAPFVSASPIMLVKRDGGSSSVVKVVVPVVVVGALAIITLLVIVIRKGWHRRMRGWGETAAANFGPNPGVTELTAQQLAGPDAPTLRTRITRRNRRTPSQISSRSLPAYMKEPGEHEVVIYRGPDDLEDATNIVVPMPSVTEAAETPDFSASVDASISVSRIYVPMPDSPHDMPLLSREDSRSTGELDPPAGLSADVSMRTDDSRSGLLQGRSPDPGATPDPRGAAPPYFEVTPMGHLNVPSNSDMEASPQLSLDVAPTPDPSEDAHAPAPADNANAGANPRRSRFLGLFHPRHGSTRAAAAPPADSPTPSGETDSSNGHARDDSGSSLGPPLTSNRQTRLRSGSTRTHRPSFSGSGSLFSVVTRSRSHLLDSPTPGGPLTSPSMISLNSISAPIPHTLVRTEFTYPRAGPTPEQIALISSREGIVRFGMPYGDEAIAYHHAASSSRMDLPDFAPPDFEEAMGRPRSGSTVTAETPLEEPTPRRNNADLPSGDDTGSDESGPAAGGRPDHSPQAAQNETSSTNPSETTNASSLPVAASSGSPAETRSSVETVNHPLATDGPATPPTSDDTTKPASSFNEHTGPPAKQAMVPSPLSRAPYSRAESALSSRTDTTFATAEEFHSAATSPTTEEPESFLAAQAGSQAPTPRVVPLVLAPEADDDASATSPVTPTASTPATEVGRAL